MSSCIRYVLPNDRTTDSYDEWLSANRAYGNTQDVNSCIRYVLPNDRTTDSYEEWVTADRAYHESQERILRERAEFEYKLNHSQVTIETRKQKYHVGGENIHTPLKDYNVKVYTYNGKVIHTENI